MMQTPYNPMPCPTCGYMMSAFDLDCPRCANLRSNPPPKPAPAETSKDSAVQRCPQCQKSNPLLISVCWKCGYDFRNTTAQPMPPNLYKSCVRCQEMNAVSLPNCWKCGYDFSVAPPLAYPMASAAYPPAMSRKNAVLIVFALVFFGVFGFFSLFGSMLLNATPSYSELRGKISFNMTGEEMTQAIGSPYHTQHINGLGNIWYYHCRDGEAQFVFDGDRLTTANKY